MILSGENLVTWEQCQRRFTWTDKFPPFRISLLAALYRSLDAGVRAEEDPEGVAQNEMISCAREPGLDVLSGNLYAVAMHYAKLAGILAAALRSAYREPWKPMGVVPLVNGGEWKSAAYDTGDGHPRRIALMDKWNETRKQIETLSWRTIGETIALDSPILVTAIEIGSSLKRRRYSYWTRCYRHPRNHEVRFRTRDGSNEFSSSWDAVWREDSGVSTQKWLEIMHNDGCMKELVHTIVAEPPARKSDYMDEMERMKKEMMKDKEVSPMRLAGCFGFHPCPYVYVCHGKSAPNPEAYGFIRRQS